MLIRTLPAQISSVGENEVVIRMMTGTRARDGHILDPLGCVLENYNLNPIQLWQHDPNKPVGRNSDIRATADYIEARTIFAPAGVSPIADEIRGLVKAGVVTAVSIGFDIVDGVPLDPAKPRSGLRVSKWELLECSFVSVPADPGAVVVARSEGIGMSNRAVVAEGGARASARLSPPPTTQKRGLCEVAQLAWLLGELGWVQASSKFESELEGDDSPVPAMIGEALKALGDAFLAMASEEVNEMLDGAGVEVDIDIDSDDIEPSERSWVSSARTKRVRVWRFAIAKIRAGKTISAANQAKIDEASSRLSDARARGEEAKDALSRMGDHAEAIADAHSRAIVAHSKATAAMDGVDAATPERAAETLAALKKHHLTVGRQLDAIGDGSTRLGDAQSDAEDAVSGNLRCVRSAERCMRSLSDVDSEDIQTSDGDEDSEGAENGRAADYEFRQRQVAVLTLAASA